MDTVPVIDAGPMSIFAPECTKNRRLHIRYPAKSFYGSANTNFV